MSHQDAALTDHVFRFASFRLSVRKRLLLEDGRPVPVGSRALELLIALVERRGELASKQELIARVWPTTVVAEGNLTAQMTALRRALRDGRDGSRFIISEPGRGYRFVMPVDDDDEVEFMAPSLAPKPSRGAPSLMRMVQLCYGFIQPVKNGVSAPEHEGTMADAVLQQGIRALELARVLVSRAGAAGGEQRDPRLTS